MTGVQTCALPIYNATEDIKNHAYNPGTAPAANAYSPLDYINEQHANKNVLDGTQETTNDLAGTSDTTDQVYASGQVSVSGNDSATDQTTRTITGGKLKAYEKLLELLNSDVTGEFISKFKICFKQFVMPERTWIYVTEDDE